MTKDEAVKAYDQLVQFRQQNQLQKTKENLGKVETHHILPISCGGEDISENRINLFAKEHFMAHVYLWIIHHEDEFHYQTMCALNMMVKGSFDGSRKELRDFILISEEYQKAREEFAKLQSDKLKTFKNPMFQKKWYYDPISLISKPYIVGQQPLYWLEGRKPVKTIYISLHKFILDNIPEIERIDDLKKFDSSYGNKANNRQVKRYLNAKYGTKCFNCGRNDKKIYIHNIDGNMQNLSANNYELLCKDCYFASGNIGWQLKIK